ncbi:MAG: RluA family pseudouridine synthase [Rhodospirillales bacterium]|nr:RluA family pseudouridine synthase [Rhodospirillales bacterium]
MPPVELIAVAADEDGLRLDRWFRRRYPAISHSLLEKWLRRGDVRVDGRRIRAGERLCPGQLIRIPPHRDPPAPVTAAAATSIPERDARALLDAVLYIDEEVIAVNKWAGLAVQGGSKVRIHLDAMLDALRFGDERPRLVHRLDRETSGVLLLGRSASAAAWLTAAFRGKQVSKLYWAIVVGVPSASAGRVSLSLAKRGGADGERVIVDPTNGRPATTNYWQVDHAGERAAWLALEPLTGRTHQLRVHCAALGTPILGDRKYGQKATLFPDGENEPGLHLLARGLRFLHPRKGPITVRAPLPPFMRESWRSLGFSLTHPRAEPSEWTAREGHNSGQEKTARQRSPAARSEKNRSQRRSPL